MPTTKKSVNKKPTKQASSTIQKLSPLELIHAQQKTINDGELALPALFDKALAQVSKQLDQYQQKAAKAKAKVAAHKQKLKATVGRLKTKKTAANKTAVEKSKAQLLTLETTFKQLSADMVSIKEQYKTMKLEQKKRLARSKALAAFEKSWEKASAKKPKKKVVKKKTAKKVTKKADVKSADTNTATE